MSPQQVKSPTASRSDQPVRIGISSCLLGNPVRHDGGHKRDAFLVETFGRYVEWVPVCPEVELGLGTPRATLQLERAGDDVRLVMPETGADYTGAMRRWAARRVAALAREQLCGYVLKSHSPSCGMARVKVSGAHGVASTSGRGLFAEALLRRFPNLPVVEESRLSDPVVREGFIERVFAYRGLCTLFTPRWTISDLAAFHTAHKLQLMAHASKATEQLGRLVAGAAAVPRAELHERYAAQFMSALAIVATPRRHANILRHLVGHIERRLDNAARRELLAAIADYCAGRLPLLVPLTLLRHYARCFEIDSLAWQVYLEPHPQELMLRHHG